METVDVSQATVVSEAPAVATPPEGLATLAVLPSAVQDFARFFLNLTGSSSPGAVGSVAGVAAPASGVGVQLCPSAPGGGAVAPCAATAAPAGLTGSPSALAALPVSSVRKPLDPVGVAVALTAMETTERRRSVRGTGLLPLVLLLAIGSGPIGRPLSLLRMPEPWLLLPELDVRLEVFPAIFAPLRRVTGRLVLDLRVGRRGSPRERSVIAWVLVVDPPLLRVWRMTTGARPAQKQSSSSYQTGQKGKMSSGQSGKKRKNRKGKAPFSSSSGGSGRSGEKGKGAEKKST